jgi:hypothetical protein
MTVDLVKNKTENLSKFDYSVLVEQKEGGYTAKVWGLPDWQVFAATREEALSKLHSFVKEYLQNVEIVTQKIEVPLSENPWMKIAGKYKNDPQFDDMLADIEAYRRERDAEMEEYYRQMDAEEEQA